MTTRNLLLTSIVEGILAAVIIVAAGIILDNRPLFGSVVIGLLIGLGTGIGLLLVFKNQIAEKTANISISDPVRNAVQLFYYSLSHPV